MEKLLEYKSSLPRIAVVALAGLLWSGSSKPEEGRWVPIFNGKDLDGWTPKFAGYESGVNHRNTFRVEDGVLQVRYDEWESFDGKFGHLFYQEHFSRYRLRLEYRFVGDQVPGAPGWALRNNGVMLHGQAVDTMKLDQSFPDSIEVQLLGGAGKGPRPTGNVCTPGTRVVIDGKLIDRHCTNSRSPTYDGDQWVSLEIEVNGSGTIRHVVNGELVLEYESPQLDDGTLLERGSISLQAESHPTDFRNIEIQILER